MRPEQRAERAELEPAHEQLRRKFLRRHESAYVGAPIRDSAQTRVDRHRDVRAQSFPRGIHVARPQKRRVPLHARVSIAMQRERPLIRPIQLWTLPIHAIARQARCDVQRIAFIRPPPVDAQRENRPMFVPITARLFFYRQFRIARIVNGAVHRARLDYHVQRDFEMLLMQLVENRLRIGKNFLVERELAVVRVPPGRAKAGAQINHRVARQFLLAECSSLFQNLFPARQRPMRLLISQAPQRRQFRQSSELAILTHNGRRIARNDQENIQRKCSRRLEAAFRAAEIECPERLMKIHRPPARADDPRNRHAAAMRAKLIPSLSAAHLIGRSAAIELRPSFAKTEQRHISGREGNHASFRIDLEMLNTFDLKRKRREVDLEPIHSQRFRTRSNDGPARGQRRRRQRSVVRNRWICDRDHAETNPDIG